jgi:molecular chaperone GrpE (heat shock protein)
MTTFVKNTNNISEEELKQQEQIHQYIIKKRKIALLSKIQSLEIQIDLIQGRTNELNVCGFHYFNPVAQSTIQESVIQEIKKEIFELFDKIESLK